MATMPHTFMLDILRSQLPKLTAGPTKPEPNEPHPACVLEDGETLPERCDALARQLDAAFKRNAEYAIALDRAYAERAKLADPTRRIQELATELARTELELEQVRRNAQRVCDDLVDSLREIAALPEERLDESGGIAECAIARAKVRL